MQVKFQVNQGRDKPRIVSTVESTNYTRVGFKILSDTGVEKTTKSWEVFKKIESVTDGLDYGYSPVVFDISSEYFMTVTLENVPANKWYSARAYWVTPDGTMVTGTARNVRMTDYDNKIANVPVRIYADNVQAGDEITVTYDSTYFTYQGYEAGKVDAEATAKIMKMVQSPVRCHRTLLTQMVCL